MRALGRAVGVTAPTLYDYFANKEAVLDALYVEGAELLHRLMSEAVAATRPGRERLRAIGAAYRTFAIANRDLFHLIFGQVDAAYRPGEDQRAHATKLFDLLVGVVREAMALGDLRSDDPAAVGEAAWAMVHGFVTLEVNGLMGGGAPGEADEAFARDLGFLFDGLQPNLDGHPSGGGSSPRSSQAVS